MKWFIQNGHVYLQKWCIIEVICLFFLAIMFYQQVNFIFQNIFKLVEWQVGALAPFALATWGALKECFASILEKSKNV